MDDYKKADFPTVGVFDSGIGGLNLLAHCKKNMPALNYIYCADNYAVPYGSRTAEEVYSRTCYAFDCMKEVGVTAAVVACNTATALCIDKLRKRYTFPIVGIQPAVKTAIKYYERCAVLATSATAHSDSFAALIKQMPPQSVTVYPCRELAQTIENVAPNFDKISHCALPAINEPCVVLGCTHYAFIKNIIAKWYGVPIFDGIVGTADHLKTILGNFDHFSKNDGKITFFGGDFAKNEAVFHFLMQEN